MNTRSYDLEKRKSTMSVELGRTLLGALLCVLGGAHGALAETPSTPPPAPSTAVATPAPSGTPAKPEEKVKTGVIASQGTFSDRTGLDVQTSGSAPGDEVSVVSGSISRTGSDDCTAKIVNNGEKTYSVSFNVVGKSKSGSTPLNKSFSATIAPKKSVEKLVTGCSKDLNLAILLKSARALK